MSLEALTVVLNHSKSKGAAKIVLMGIANHLGPDADEGAWPAQARLSRYANITERGIRKAIDQLVELGELTVMEHAGKSSGRNKPNRYLITLSCPETCDRSISHKDVLTTGTNDSDDRNFSPTTGTFGHDDRNSSSSEPIREPVLRTSKKATAIPANFLPESLGRDIEQHKTTDIHKALHEFIEYWTDAGTKRANWEATWRNNLQRVVEMGKYKKQAGSIWDTIEETR